MGLGDSTGRLTYLNIKKGKIAYKKDGVPGESGFIEGFITKVSFEEKEWEGKKYEQANIKIVDGEDVFMLQMKTDSGYFRAFCNAFKSGNPQFKTKISPTYKEEGTKKNSGCFVEQGGTPLKWFYNKEKNNLDEVPKVKKMVFGGKDLYDGSEQIAFWKNWLLSLKFKDEMELASHSQPQDNGLNETKADAKKAAAKKTTKKDEKDDFLRELHGEDISIDDDEGDAPF